MSISPIIIVPGEPNSIFLEIYFKALLKKKYKSPLIIICSHRLLMMQMKKLKYKFKINLIHENFLKNEIKRNQINLININYNQKKAFEKISSKSNIYIENCFNKALKILKKGISKKFINGPISKKTFLKKKFLGITEYLTKKTFSKNSAMLIYDKKLSVLPITTHLPIKLVAKEINKKKLINKIKIVDIFFKKFINKTPNFAVTGLNPHCESILEYNEDYKIIKPSIEYLKNKKIKIKGPFPADTVFLKKNSEKFDIIVGMYHDQVLAPIKTLNEFNSINLTVGLPFIRVSPDHGPNEKMLGKNKSNPLSLINSINFLDKI